MDLNYSNKDNYNRVKLPNQKASSKTKNTKKWKEDSLRYFVENIGISQGNRKSKFMMENNWDYFNSILNNNSYKEMLDPLGLAENAEDLETDRNLKVFNVIKKPIMSLIGEELKRANDIKAYAINSTAINQKDREFKQRANEVLSSFINKDTIPEKELKEALEELDHYYKHDLQSAHEKMANQIIQAYLHDTDMNLTKIFNEGFRNLQVVAESVYVVEEYGDDLDVRLLDSTSFYVYGLNNSNLIEDGYAWVEIDYLHPNTIIEKYYEYLTEKQVDTILENDSSDSTLIIPEYISSFKIDEIEDSKTYPYAINGQFIPIDGSDFDYNRNYRDNEGNIRVANVSWLSLRKIGILKYYDENMQEQKTFVDEYYPVDESKGEEIKWVYFNELWSGTMIGDKILINIKPNDLQLRSLNNPAKVKPNYVGVVLGINRNAVSRLDDLIVYQDLFNVWMNKLIELWANNLGKIASMDLAEIPTDKFTMNEWYAWIKNTRIAFKNSFQEGNQGVAKGQLAGNMQQNSKVIDLSMAQEISQSISMLQWILGQINEVSSVPETRQGNLTGNETMGTVLEANTRATVQTEQDFYLHSLVKSKVLTLVLELAKIKWADSKVKKQFLLDDLSNYIVEIDGKILSEADYGIKILNSSKAAEMNNIFKQLIHPAMQNGSATLSDAAKALLAESPSDALNILSLAEEKRQKQQQDIQQQQVELQKQAQQVEQQKMQFELNKEKELLILEYKLKTELETVKNLQKQYIDSEGYSRDDNKNGIEDKIELDVANIERKTKEKELADKKEIELKKLELKKEELRIKLKEVVAKNKAINSQSRNLNKK